MDTNTQQVKIKLLDDRAKLPEKKSAEAAAFDLYALEDTELTPFQVIKVRTGIAIEVPKGFKGEVYTRSGYGANGIFVANQPGKIDSDYRGELFVLLMYVPDWFGRAWEALLQILTGFAKSGASQTSCINLSTEINHLCRLDRYKIKAGDRIAQFEIQEVVSTQLIQVESLSETERGTGGMGSSGK